MSLSSTISLDYVCGQQRVVVGVSKMPLYGGIVGERELVPFLML